MTYILDWENKGVYWKYSGHISGQEIVEGSTAIYGDPRFDTLRYKLVDFLDIETIDIDKNEVALIAHQHRAAERSNPYIKNAIVIKSKTELTDSFVAFFSDSSWEVKVFQNLDEANRWLDRHQASDT